MNEFWERSDIEVEGDRKSSRPCASTCFIFFKRQPGLRAPASPRKVLPATVMRGTISGTRKSMCFPSWSIRHHEMPGTC